MSSHSPEPQRILIVDDLANNIVGIEAILSDLENIETDSAEGGFEAIEKMKEQDYDLVLVDVQMPGMDGFQLAEVIRKSPNIHETPIVFISANYLQEQDAQEAFLTGAWDYLMKPISQEILLAKVRLFLERSSMKKELEQLRSELKAYSELVGKMTAFASGIQDEVKELAGNKGGAD